MEAKHTFPLRTAFRSAWVGGAAKRGAEKGGEADGAVDRLCGHGPFGNPTVAGGEPIQVSRG